MQRESPFVFVGREEETRVLTEPNWRSRALLVVVYGRRRVGKTALVGHAYRDRALWKFEGLENGDTRTQLALFTKDLCRYTGQSELRVNDWDSAFRALDRALASYATRHDRSIVVFLDEFQWLCEMKPKLVSLFKYHWDNYLSRHTTATFVLCGSVSSFIVKKVVRSRALYGRIDIELALGPLPLSEARQLLPDSMSAGECLEVNMVFGGIPQYLSELNPRLSLVQNLNEYAFKPSGYFFQEFGRLFISHFASHPGYERILRAVAGGAATPRQIAARCGLSSGGGLSELLGELVLAGFLRKCIPINKKPTSRLVRYRIDDEFLHFHFSFIGPRTADIAAGNVEYAQITDSRVLSQWQGYAFERLCRKHAVVLARHLGFSGINYRFGKWFRRDSDRTGAQVDLLFVRADRVLTVCEMKYVNRLKPAAIGAAIVRKTAALRDAFPGYGIHRVLVLGSDVPGRESAARHFDRVLLAEEVFF